MLRYARAEVCANSRIRRSRARTRDRLLHDSGGGSGHDDQVRAAAFGQPPTSAATSFRAGIPGYPPRRSGATTRAGVRDGIGGRNVRAGAATSMVNISPMGPWPTTSTKSRRVCGSHCTTAFRQVFSGSTSGALERDAVGNLLDAAREQSSPSPGHIARNRRRPAHTRP